jgi:hypothetical protein
VSIVSSWLVSRELIADEKVARLSSCFNFTASVCTNGFLSLAELFEVYALSSVSQDSYALISSCNDIVFWKPSDLLGQDLHAAYLVEG